MSHVYVVRAPGKAIRVLRRFGFGFAGAAALTWERISKLELRVLVLLDQIKSERLMMRHFVGISLKYLEQLSALVGLGRKDATLSELRPDAAYKTVHEKLLNNFGCAE